MAKEEKAQIIIVKRRKKGGGGHHGGAWKVAYADFVTAMMAFFLVMWLVSSISKDQRAALFDYFKNPSMEPGKTVRAAPGQAGPGGASTSVISLGGGMDAPRVTVVNTPDPNAKLKPPVPAASVPQPVKEMELAEAKKITDEAEHKKLESLLDELRQAIDKSQALKPFKDQLLLDITPEGLRIQIVDKQNRPMFDIGSARLKDYTDTILKTLAGYLNTVPNRISVTGHTDIRPYPGGVNYTNWELSADRANAARRALQSGGLAPAKVARVVGLSSSVLFNKDDPQNPINRRISIIVMTKEADDSALKSESRPETPVGGVSMPPLRGVTAPAAAAPIAPPAAPLAAPAAAASDAVPEKGGDTAKPDTLPADPAPVAPTLEAPVAAADGAPGL
jgi:chemotaxis protein MotB